MFLLKKVEIFYNFAFLSQNCDFWLFRSTFFNFFVEISQNFNTFWFSKNKIWGFAARNFDFWLFRSTFFS